MQKIATREKPILFSGEMVRAIRDGRKTQTRRIINPQPPLYIDELHGNELRNRAPYELEHPETGCIVGSGFFDDDDLAYKCPFGRHGDELWVRETWAVHGCLYDDLPPRGIHGSVKGGAWKDGDSIWYAADGENPTPATGSCKQRGRWRVSIHMPRWASRIQLLITDVQVERLNDITEEDAKAEGTSCRSDLAWGGLYGTDPDTMPAWAVDHGHRYGFREIWEQINGEGSWDANPWVWVVGFENVKAAASGLRG